MPQTISGERPLLSDDQLRMIREARDAKGLTRLDLSKLTGIHYSSIYQVESGKINPKIDMLARLLAPLGLSVQVLIGPAASKPQRRGKKGAAT